MLGIYVRTSSEKDQRESPVEQQKQVGMKFAKEHQFEFKIYEDKGISGYKINEDDEAKPYDNRPGFVDLMGDIRKKEINMVWAYENSRFSRNAYASAHIFREFAKHNIKVFVKDTEYNITDPQTKAFLGMMNIMSELERDSIVSRTTRGSHKKINDGKRSFGKLYGYRKVGVDKKGYQILEKVESEHENIKYGYKRILEGATLRQLTVELYNKKSFDKLEALRLTRYWYKVLRHFSYTGHELNLDGLELMRKFDSFEIDSIATLSDEKYYTKSTPYPHKLISIEEWIKVVERLRVNRKMRNDNKVKKASKDIATGLIKCGECGQKYYSYTHEGKKRGKAYRYRYYKHFVLMKKIEKCSQKKSFIVGNTNEIFKLFYFYFYMIFDNTSQLMQEAQRKIKKQQDQLKEQIKQYERNERQYRKQIEKFNFALDDSADAGEIKILARRISEAEENIKTNSESISKTTVELEQLNIQYAGNEMTNTYYSVKDKIHSFFNEMNIEEQREELVKTIKECIVFGSYLLIDTGTVLCVFNTEHKYSMKDEMLKNLDKDAIYREYFIENLTAEKRFLDVTDIGMQDVMKEKIFEKDEMVIFDCKVNGRNQSFYKTVAGKLFEKYKIRYDFANHASVLFFFKDTIG